MDVIQYVVGNSTDFISNGGLIVGFLLVFIECFIPALPLSVFVALNVAAFGFFIGCLISWMATCLGSYICYRFFTFVDRKVSDKILKRRRLSKIKTTINKFKKIKITELVLIITLPFTPSSLINILCGITRMAKEKFIVALLIGKCFSIVFWGYIGKSLVESFTDIKSIIYIVITLILAYIISKIVGRKMNIE